MNTKKDTVIVNGTEINPTHFLTTLQSNPKDNTKTGVFVNFEDYEALGYFIKDIIGVCSSALMTINDNTDRLNEFEIYNYCGANGASVANVLQFVMKILPNSEFELLDKMKPKI
ncbi:hypothetical protein CMT48_07665 [Elizabethkingia anophelis]|nr:hypothetical protein [Elizabethkingia anophelis]